MTSCGTAFGHSDSACSFFPSGSRIRASHEKRRGTEIAFLCDNIYIDIKFFLTESWN